MLDGVRDFMYDILGYLFPGIILLLAVVVIFWCLLAPAGAIGWPQFAAEQWILTRMALP